MNFSPTMRRIHDERPVEQLWRRERRTAALGSENGRPMLDWVDAVPRLLADDTLLQRVADEGKAIWERGIRHVIWAGMGGSIMAVRALVDLGFCGAGDALTIHPLDSTDPAAINRIVEAIARRKGVAVEEPALFDDTLMIGVSMGMTSEEPITHLSWFAEVLAEAGRPLPDHLLVMTLPGSYLDRFAAERELPMLSIQPDGGTGTPGRLSAPGTRVFLLPAALWLAQQRAERGTLRGLLRDAWQRYDLPLARRQPERHPFVRLAAILADAADEGSSLLLLALPGGWEPLLPWIEQLMEESLGKSGKGVLVFGDQRIAGDYGGSERGYPCGTPLRDPRGMVQVAADAFHQPLSAQGPLERLAAMAAAFLGWRLTMAMYAYLHDITFAGQPAVEAYKARARSLRELENPLQSILGRYDAVPGDGLTLLPPPGLPRQATPAALVAGSLRSVRYVDLTINGDLSADQEGALRAVLARVANGALGVPYKLRRAPAAYHSTEQSEMDGPSGVVSLRVVARGHEASLRGSYTDRFLCAQAAGTWESMVEKGRTCFLAIVDGSLAQGAESVARLIEGAME